MELLELYRRGKIPKEGLGPAELSLQQGFFETDLKNKWWPIWNLLAEYRPPPRTVTALIREGALTDAQGLQLFREAGLTAELAQVYVNAAHHQRTQPDKELAKADVLRLYRDKLIDHKAGEGFLEQLGYRREFADWLLDLEDFRESAALYQGAEGRLRSLYLHRKLDETGVQTALKELGVANDAVTTLLHRWSIERAQTVQHLTSAEWVDAAFYEIVTEEEAYQGLLAEGWTPWDAWVRLGLRLHRKSSVAEPARRALAQ